MKIDNEIWRKFETDYIRANFQDIEKNYQLFEDMYKFVIDIKGHLRDNPLEGLEGVFRIAKAINSV